MKERPLDLAGELDLAEIVAFVARAAAVVTNDSGPMHIAGALGTPFVALFGPTHPDLGFAPGYPGGTVLHAGLSCSPCSFHGERPCRVSGQRCLTDITPRMVLDALPRLTS
jgi:heptosyltransferase-2